MTHLEALALRCKGRAKDEAKNGSLNWLTALSRLRVLRLEGARFTDMDLSGIAGLRSLTQLSIATGSVAAIREVNAVALPLRVISLLCCFRVCSSWSSLASRSPRQSFPPWSPR
jgi:hypothetical protein